MSGGAIASNPDCESADVVVGRDRWSSWVSRKPCLSEPVNLS
jgi:hypothetical protein